MAHGGPVCSIVRGRPGKGNYPPPEANPRPGRLVNYAQTAGQQEYAMSTTMVTTPRVPPADRGASVEALLAALAAAQQKIAEQDKEIASLKLQVSLWRNLRDTAAARAVEAERALAPLRPRQASSL